MIIIWDNWPVWRALKNQKDVTWTYPHIQHVLKYFKILIFPFEHLYLLLEVSQPCGQKSSNLHHVKVVCLLVNKQSVIHHRQRQQTSQQRHWLAGWVRSTRRLVGNKVPVSEWLHCSPYIIRLPSYYWLRCLIYIYIFK